MKLANLKKRWNLGLVNHLFSGNHFWSVKRTLLRNAGISVGEGTKVVGPIYVASNLVIGSNCWIGLGFTAHGNGKVEIGDRCDVAPDVMFLTGSHAIGDHNRRAGNGTASNIKIGDGCWIGARTVFVGDICVADGSVIGCCSLVNKNVDEDVLVAGSPAKLIRHLD